jgi:Predicted membrane protein (DUF2142)
MLAVVVACYAALALTWAMTNPPFAAPDEAAHYLRAVGVSDSSLIGAKARLAGPGLAAKLVLKAAPSRQQLDWVNQTARSVRVPAGLSPDGFDCEAMHPARSAACVRDAAVNRAAVDETTPVGTYQPLPYLAPAAVLRLDGHAAGSLRLARLASVVPWLALLAAAAYALWDEALGMISLSGLIVATTPMVVFLGSSLSGSSLEVMGSVAFFSVLLGIVACPVRGGRLTALLGLAAATGLVLALSRSLGPLWVAIDVGLAAMLAGRARIGALLAANRTATLLACACVLAGVALNRYWEALYGPHAALTLVPSLHSLWAAAHDLVRTQPQLIASFGYTDVHPSEVQALWWLLWLALIVAGLRAARGRERRTLALGVAVLVVGPVYLDAAVLRNTGFGLQGRHYLPFAALLPVLAFRVLGPRVSAHPWRAPLFGALVTATSAMQLYAWAFNSHRYAVGSGGPLWFLAIAQWSPPLGWTSWLCFLSIVAVAASGLTWRAVWRGGQALSPHPEPA